MTTPTPQTTLVTFLLDKSGSMQTIRDDTIGAFNVYLETLQKGETAKQTEFTFLQFDTQSLDKICVNREVENVEMLTEATFVPRGGTPLIDAACKTIKAVESAIKQRDSEPKIVICIQTDGYENASTEFTRDDLHALIKEKTEAGWQFNFMGAGIDAYDQGVRFGFSVDNTISYDSKDRAATRAAFKASAENTTLYASGAMASTAYSSAQKFAAKDAFVEGAGKAKPSVGSGGSAADVWQILGQPAATPFDPNAIANGFVAPDLSHAVVRPPLDLSGKAAKPKPAVARSSRKKPIVDEIKL